MVRVHALVESLRDLSSRLVKHLIATLLQLIELHGSDGLREQGLKLAISVELLCLVRIELNLD